MPSAKRSSSSMPCPSILEGSHQELCLESSLAELRLHHFQVASCHSSEEILLIFEHYPMVPGVVLEEKGQLLGMVSRQRLLECLVYPKGTELFLSQPLSVLHRYIRSNSLVLPETMTILAAAQLALRRPISQQGEPIVVSCHNATQPTYYLLDSHELNIAYWQIRGIETQVRYERSQLQMIQTEKMASLGRLVDGVAHEILDPVGFIWGNLVHLSEYTQQVMELLSAYEQNFPEIPPSIAHLRTEMELDYLRHDIPQTIAGIRSGADRLKNLASSLQTFCHIDEVYPKPADLHDCLDSILLLLKSHLTGEIEIVRNYGHLPPVNCYAGQLTQVFTNILSNAVNALMNQAVRQQMTHAFGSEGSEVQQYRQPKPQITITTQVRSFPASFYPLNPALRWVSICIADNGPGFSPEKYQQILAAFAVENRADKETSLAMSYQIVTARHGGKFYFRSPVSSAPANGGTQPGAEFEILLPMS
ncbi:histidine kinase [filamentous cyanobacterium CCP2]|nr:histidine kinase [filamentous cyanobacterium CCP2]